MSVGSPSNEDCFEPRGSRSFGLSWRPPTIPSYVTRSSGGHAPRPHDENRSSHHPPRIHALRYRRRVSQPPGSLSRAPSTEFFKDHPSISISTGVHSHSPKAASARRCQASCMFRPRGSSPPRRLPPPDDARACCIPQPTMRFTGLPHCDVACPRRAPCFPTGAYPPEPFPSEKRCPRHLGPLPPCRYRTRVRPDFEALFRSEIRCDS